MLVLPCPPINRILSFPLPLPSNPIGEVVFDRVSYPGVLQKDLLRKLRSRPGSAVPLPSPALLLGSSRVVFSFAGRPPAPPPLFLPRMVSFLSLGRYGTRPKRLNAVQGNDVRRQGPVGPV